MMLKVLLLFVLLIAGIVVGPMIAGHQGYVLIQTDNYNIETSVTGLVIILIVAMVVLFAIEWLLRRIFRTGAHTRGWFVGRKRRRARKQTEQALLKLAEGDYQQVEKLMSKNADHAEQPVVNYLLAAEAAQQRGDEVRAVVEPPQVQRGQRQQRARQHQAGWPLAEHQPSFAASVAMRRPSARASMATSSVGCGSSAAPATWLAP